MLMEEVLTEMSKAKRTQRVKITGSVFSRPEGHCPVCDTLVYREWNYGFCGKCGQELGWGDV